MNLPNNSGKNYEKSGFARLVKVHFSCFIGDSLFATRAKKKGVFTLFLVTTYYNDVLTSSARTHSLTPSFITLI